MLMLCPGREVVYCTPNRLPLQLPVRHTVPGSAQNPGSARLLMRIDLQPARRHKNLQRLSAGAVAVFHRTAGVKRRCLHRLHQPGIFSEIIVMPLMAQLIVPFDGLQEIAPIPFIRKHQRRQLLQRVRTVKGPAFSGPIPVKNDLVLILASGLLQGIRNRPYSCASV